MLKILYGNHTFLRQQALADLKAELGDWQVVAVEDLTPGGLEDLILARSLFTQKQNLIFYNLSENKLAWDKFTDLADQVALADDLTIVLIEDRLDGRSKFGKTAVKSGWAIEFKLPKDYDQSAAIKFITEQAAIQDLKLTSGLARQIFDLAGPDPWDQFQVISKLAVLGEVTPEVISQYIPRNNFGNVFMVLELALAGNLTRLEQELDQLEAEDIEPNQFWGLLVSQILNLLALSASSGEVGAVSELGIHPYAAQKMVSLLQQVNFGVIKQAVNLMTETDLAFKTGDGTIWPSIRVCLFKISQLKA